MEVFIDSNNFWQEVTGPYHYPYYVPGDQNKFLASCNDRNTTIEPVLSNVRNLSLRSLTTTIQWNPAEFYDTFHVDQDGFYAIGYRAQYSVLVTIARDTWRYDIQFIIDDINTQLAADPDGSWTCSLYNLKYIKFTYNYFEHGTHPPQIFFGDAPMIARFLGFLPTSYIPSHLIDGTEGIVGVKRYSYINHISSIYMGIQPILNENFTSTNFTPPPSDVLFCIPYFPNLKSDERHDLGDKGVMHFEPQIPISYNFDSVYNIKQFKIQFYLLVDRSWLLIKDENCQFQLRLNVETTETLKLKSYQSSYF